MRKNKGLLFLTVLLVMIFSSHVNAGDNLEEWQFYRINAQYRGAVKKSFRSIGCGIAWFKELPQKQVQAIIHVCVLHPEKKSEIYSFRLNMVLQRSSRGLELVKEVYSEFNGISGDRCDQIRQLAGLWLHMLDFKRSGGVNPELESMGASLKIERADRRNGDVELTTRWSGRKDFSGKYFFKVNPSGRYIEKFRFRSGKLSVSLVTDTSESVTAAFANKEPFASIVFK